MLFTPRRNERVYCVPKKSWHAPEGYSRRRGNYMTDNVLPPFEVNARVTWNLDSPGYHHRCSDYGEGPFLVSVRRGGVLSAQASVNRHRYSGLRKRGAVGTSFGVVTCMQISTKTVRCANGLLFFSQKPPVQPVCTFESRAVC